MAPEMPLSKPTSTVPLTRENFDELRRQIIRLQEQNARLLKFRQEVEDCAQYNYWADDEALVRHIKTLLSAGTEAHREDDQEWDASAERLMVEAGLVGTSDINQNATSMLDVFESDIAETQPVDEKAEFEKAYRGNGIPIGSMTRTLLWAGWQARAALEKMK